MRSSDELDLDGSIKGPLQFLRNVRKKFKSGSTEVLWGKTSVDIPYKKLVPFSEEVCAAHTGPDGGIGYNPSDFPNPELERNLREDFTMIDWTKWHHRAYGMATSLYERTLDGEHFSGDPVADVFAIIARPNNCILVLADGVNWGDKARLAARSAVKGCMEYLNKNIFDSSTTHDVMEHLVHSFQYAQKCITDSEATMTTLCAGVVCELHGTNKWGLCTLNVGDSLAFVYSRKSELREVTIGSHLDVRRDLTNPGGSLGKVDGYNPDLGNLTCSFTTLEAGDIVFLTSDGITDNFDPVICKPCPKEITSFNQVLQDRNAKEKKYSDTDSEIKEFESRHNGMINEMKEVLATESLPCDGNEFSAKELCGKFLTKVILYTEKKRLAQEAYAEYMEKLKHKKYVETTSSRDTFTPDFTIKGLDTHLQQNPNTHLQQNPNTHLQQNPNASSLLRTKQASDNTEVFPIKPKLYVVRKSCDFGQVTADNSSDLLGRITAQTSPKCANVESGDIFFDSNNKKFRDSLCHQESEYSQRGMEFSFTLPDSAVDDETDVHNRYNSPIYRPEFSNLVRPCSDEQDSRSPSEERKNVSPKNVSPVNKNIPANYDCSLNPDLFRAEHFSSKSLENDYCNGTVHSSGLPETLMQTYKQTSPSKVEARLIKEIENACGKLDHASIVSFEVGYFYPNPRHSFSSSNEYDVVDITESMKLCNSGETNNVLQSLFL